MEDESLKNDAIEREIDRDRSRRPPVKVLMLGSKSATRNLMEFLRTTCEKITTVEEMSGMRRKIIRNLFKAIISLSTFAATQGIDLRRPMVPFNTQDFEGDLKKEIHSLVESKSFKTARDAYIDVYKYVQDEDIHDVGAILDHITAPLMERILSDGYIPTSKDIALFGTREEGIDEFLTSYGGATYKFIRPRQGESSIHKWADHFRNVQIMAFGVDLVEIFRRDEDDQSFVYSKIIKSFNDLLRSQQLEKIPVVLILDGMGEMEERLRSMPIYEVFPDYEGAPWEFGLFANYVGESILKSCYFRFRKAFYIVRTGKVPDIPFVAELMDYIKDSLLFNGLFYELGEIDAEIY